MKYSLLGTKTNKNAKDLVSKNATLLLKAGFIDQTMAGVYTFLPLGWRVLMKIEQIVREEMDKIGVEVFMPSISPKDLWETTNRLNSIDVLMKTHGANKKSLQKNDAEYILNSTHEELITPIAQKFNPSYKDLPIAYYQIQTKFRNEPRAKSGILRCREFRMKDLYSFHESELDLKKYYEVVKSAYMKTFQRLGLDDTMVVLASGGDFTNDFSHEFQTPCESGEDTIFIVPSTNVAYNREIAPSQAPLLDNNEVEKPREDVEGKGIIGVEELAKYLKIPVEKTTKTLLFETISGDIIAAAVRGGYDVNEEKLCKAAGVKSVALASEKKVQEITGAAIGYAGILNLPKNVQVFMDESMRGRCNFECGANKTNYHSININFGRDLKEPKQFYDIKTAREGDKYPETGEQYEVKTVSEVGNIFPLNIKFSKAFGYEYVAEDGSKKPVYMGSYGIGTSRVMGVIVEKFADRHGLVWPDNIAPFAVHLISLQGVEKQAEKVYEKLRDSGIEVLWDDRDESAGVKFADADLIGIPWRVVVSKKTLRQDSGQDGDKVEIKRRDEKKAELMSIDEFLKKL